MILTGSRVRVVESGELGTALGTDEWDRIVVQLDHVPWEVDYSEDDLVDLGGGSLQIIRTLEFNGAAGLAWKNYEEYDKRYDTALAFAWSDGLVTWQEWRD